MLFRKTRALFVISLLAFSIFAFAGFAKIGKDNSDKKDGVSWSWTDEQGPAAVGTPVQWTRTVSVDNTNDKVKKIEIKEFPKNTRFIQNNPLFEYHKNNVKYSAPPGLSNVVIDYTTPAPTATIKVTANNATHYLFDFVIDADTDVHYSDVDMPVDVPGTSWDWNYFINWKQPDGSFSQQKLYAANTDGDRKTYEKIGWRAPHLSAQAGGGGGKVSPSKIRNYDLETVRAANASLPELWFMKGILGTELVDDLDWPYLPVSLPGYQSQTGLTVKHANVQDGRIYAEPINGTGGTFILNFKTKHDFADAQCEFFGGAEILFGDGSGDTTYVFGVNTGTGDWTGGGDFDLTVSDLNQGWKNITLTSLNSVPSDQYIRFYFSTEDCAFSQGNSFTIDDVLIN